MSSDDIVVEARRRWSEWYEDEVDMVDYLAEVIPALCDEIDRLRVWSSDSHVTELEAEIERLRDQLMQTCKPCLDKSDEIERLRAELEAIPDDLVEAANEIGRLEAENALMKEGRWR